MKAKKYRWWRQVSQKLNMVLTRTRAEIVIHYWMTIENLLKL